MKQDVITAAESENFSIFIDDDIDDVIIVLAAAAADTAERKMPPTGARL